MYAVRPGFRRVFEQLEDYNYFLPDEEGGFVMREKSQDPQFTLNSFDRGQDS